MPKPWIKGIITMEILKNIAQVLGLDRAVLGAHHVWAWRVWARMRRMLCGASTVWGFVKLLHLCTHDISWANMQ